MTANANPKSSWADILRPDPSWRNVFPGLQGSIPTDEQLRVEAIKNRLRVLADVTVSPDSLRAAKSELASRDVPWLLQKLGESTSLYIDPRDKHCSCEYIDVGVGGVGLRVSEDQYCPQHMERVYPSSQWGEAPVETVLEEAEQALHADHPEGPYKNPLIPLVEDLTSFLRQNLIPRPGENIIKQFGVKVEDAEVGELPSFDSCKFVAHGNDNVKIFTRYKLEATPAYSQWVEYVDHPDNWEKD